MKVVSIVGARPQFIKCAPVSRQLRKIATEILVHTGQHYDNNMSDIFFRELGIPEPDYNLGVGSGSHGQQTGKMIEGAEEVLVKERPDYVLVYGDTNSTLAGALAAAKLNIPVGHLEAGLRSFNKKMPEEINRILADHVSSLLFCPTETAVQNLKREGITTGVFQVGDVMYDALLYNIEIAERRSIVLEKLGLQSKGYFLATVHRADNTDRIQNLKEIIDAFVELGRKGMPVVFPVHPRTRRLMGSHGFPMSPELVLTDPVSYLDMLVLEKHSRAILTDSGGVQKEAFWLKVPCVTLREETEWVETVESGSNVLAGVNRDRIIRFALAAKWDPKPSSEKMYGRGDAAERVVAVLVG